jgi:transglutaminase-like putative cysteine protease
MRRLVTSRLEFDVEDDARLALQVAVASTPAEERLAISLDGSPVTFVELAAPHGARVHQADVGPGRVVVEYAATVDAPVPAPAEPVGDLELLTYLRPSRYAEADHLVATAAAEFGGITDHAELLAAVSSWVGGRLVYVPGSSGPTDGAVDTLLKGEGVCRDYAHLVIGLLRALDIPARMAAVYAPGLQPMDFHAVAEAHVEGAWHVVDATTLAPRSSLVRIATGRDAADTAFLSSYGGDVVMAGTEILAIVDGELPGDDVHRLVTLA